MKILLSGAALAATLAFASACSPTAPAEPATPAAAVAPPYGANVAASGTFTHDGVTFYYETYGEGEPLVVIHGNGGSIGSMGKQIAFFSPRYKVIAMDSRDQGKTTDSAGPVTYEQMADDVAALLDHLKSGPADIVGWSDGGIEALLLGLRHPDKVKKLVAMAANLNPDPSSFAPELAALSDPNAPPPEEPKTPEAKRAAKMGELIATQPHIDPATLANVKAPTLVMSGDMDLISLEHTLQIYNSLPNANLAVLPNATHMSPWNDSDLFNATVQRFLDTPFVKKDRIEDLMTTAEKMKAEIAK